MLSAMSTHASTDAERSDGFPRVFVSEVAPAMAPKEGDADCVSWWQTPYGRWRLAVERHSMERFPSFHLVGEGMDWYWSGTLRSALTGRSYDVVVHYGAGFPFSAPEVVIENHAFPVPTPHLIAGSRPCLFLPDQGGRCGYDPGRTTAATIVAWTALWIHAYEMWAATGAWPGRGE